METLFGFNSANSVPKEATRKSVLPPVEKENRVLDPKKSQNIAILLRALNVTRDEVIEALQDGECFPKLGLLTIICDLTYEQLFHNRGFDHQRDCFSLYAVLSMF